MVYNVVREESVKDIGSEKSLTGHFKIVTGFEEGEFLAVFEMKDRNASVYGEGFYPHRELIRDRRDLARACKNLEHPKVSKAAVQIITELQNKSSREVRVRAEEQIPAPA